MDRFAEGRTKPEYLTFSKENVTTVNDSESSNVADTLVDIPVPLQSNTPSTLRRYGPPILIICASILFSGMHNCVRLATYGYKIPFLFIVVIRGIFQFALVTLVIVILGTEAVNITLSQKSKFLLCLRGLSGALAMTAKFGSLARLPVPVATSLFANTPIFASILGWLLLREKMTRIDIFALCASTVGSVMVGLTGKNGETSMGSVTLERSHIIGVLLGLGGAMAAATTFTIMRGMGERVHFLLSVFSHGIAMALLPTVCTLVSTRDFGEAVQFYETPLLEAGRIVYAPLAGVLLFSFAAALFQNRGAQLLSAGRVGVLRTLDIPINFLVAYIFLGEFPDSTLQLAGCAIILVGTILMSYNAMKN